MFEAFSVAEAVLPSRPSDQAAEVRIFHPPADDTKVNRALLAGCVRVCLRFFFLIFFVFFLVACSNVVCLFVRLFVCFSLVECLCCVFCVFVCFSLVLDVNQTR